MWEGGRGPVFRGELARGWVRFELCEVTRLAMVVGSRSVLCYFLRRYWFVFFRLRSTLHDVT